MPKYIYHKKREDTVQVSIQPKAADKTESSLLDSIISYDPEAKTLSINPELKVEGGKSVKELLAYKDRLVK